MSWKMAQAKQQLSAVVQQAAREPQVIMNRDKVVAAVVNAEEFARFQEWKRRGAGTFGGALREAQAIAADEAYALPVVSRGDRENPLVRSARAPARHKRHQ